MSKRLSVDGILVQWGERLFYPANRRVRCDTPRLHADAVRRRIAATIHSAPQVMVKVTGGGRGMRAIVAHLRYISKNGWLPLEDEQGRTESGKPSLRDLADEWRVAGTRIDDVGPRREAYNLMLSMPRGTADPSIVLRAAREFAQVELADHKYVMVLHDHQAHPHVHLSVRAESRSGRRLNPRKADLQRWRETFAERLRGWGIDAESTRRATRAQTRYAQPLWRIKAMEQGRATHRSVEPSGMTPRRWDALHAWKVVGEALARSRDPSDRRLAASIEAFGKGQRELPGLARRVEPSPEKYIAR